jgi:cytidylate kinase
MKLRDHADSTRADSPLHCDASYLRIDTSGLSPEQVVEQCLAAVPGLSGFVDLP